MGDEKKLTEQIAISSGADVPTAPKVSVIIPAYNTAAFIGESLDSVFAQTYTDFEVIVINDGSPDTAHLERVLVPYRSRIVYIVQKNRRAAGARNTGIHQARGEFLAFLDSDDLWLPENLAAQMKMFKDDPSLDMVYADAAFFAGSTRPGRTYMEACPSKGPVTFDSLVVESTQVCISCAVARKEIIVKAGSFDESLPQCDDYDMWLRVAYMHGKIAYQNVVLGKIRTGRVGSLGASNLKMIEAAVHILTKLERTLLLPPQTRTLMRRRIAFYQAHYDKEMAKEYLAQRDYKKAAKQLTRANRFFKSPKLALGVLCLTVGPRLLAADSFGRLMDWLHSRGAYHD